MNHPAVVKAAKEIDRATEGIYTEASEIFCRTNRDTADEFLYAKLAEIIERETKYSRLVEALKLSQKWLANSVSVVPIRGPKPLPVIAELLAEIKDMEIGPRLRS